MNQLQILGAIMLATGERPAELAKKNGIAVSTLYLVAKGKYPKKVLVRQLIAATIGKPVDEVFPPLPDQNKAAA